MDYGKLKSRKLFVKRALAATLAAITACTILPMGQPVAAKAAAPYVSLRTAFKTLQVGQKNKMTLKNNTLGWKVSKVATNDREIAMVYGKTSSSFQIKGKAAGRTTVKAKLKTDARKKSATKTVRCRVNVIAKEDAALPEEASVSTQEELEKALLNKNLKKLAIQTNGAGKIKIPAGTYPEVDLSVDAPACDIENHAVFKSITIRAIKPDTWIENAIGNVMQVAANAARIVVNEGACLNNLQFTCADAKVSLEVNGRINEVSIQAKMELSISGKPESPVNTTIEASAEGTVLVSQVPVNVTLHASATITLNEGAENSTVEIKSKDADVKVNNNTKGTITIKKADGTVETKRAANITFATSTGKGTQYYPVQRPVTDSAVTPTGPAIDDVGGGDSGWSWGTYYEYPEIGEMIDIFQPKVCITVTRSAVSASAPISMSAIFSFYADPEKVEQKDKRKAFWNCSQIEEFSEFMPLADKEQDTVDFAYEYMIEDFEEHPDDLCTGLNMTLMYLYEDDIDRGMTWMVAIEDKPILNQYLEKMEAEGWEVMELELPIIVFSNNRQAFTYLYDEANIKHTVPQGNGQ